MSEIIRGVLSPTDLQMIFDRAGGIHGVMVKVEYKRFMHPEYRSSVKGDRIYVAISGVQSCSSGIPYTSGV